MFSTVLGFFSQDVAVDLGTSTTRVYVRGGGVVCHEPTVVAVHTDGRGCRRIIAVGNEALAMVGRTPPEIQTFWPVRQGQIEDYEVAEGLLLHLLRRAHGRNGWMSPKMVVAIPHGATEMARRAFRESCEAAGAREVHLVPRSLCAAIGAELPIDEPSGQFIAEIGGGVTELSVISVQGIVSSVTVPRAGEAMDDAIIAWLRDHHGLRIGRATAEQVKIDIGTALSVGDGTRSVAGQCVERGVPRSVDVNAAEIGTALGPCVADIARAIRSVLEKTPPELASDVVDHGVVLSGGGSQLRNLDVALRQATGLPVVTVEQPTASVIEGAGRILEEMALLRALAS